MVVAAAQLVSTRVCSDGGLCTHSCQTGVRCKRDRIKYGSGPALRAEARRGAPTPVMNVRLKESAAAKPPKAARKFEPSGASCPACGSLAFVRKSSCSARCNFCGYEHKQCGI